MKYLCIKNWKKFQYDAGKKLPWIKFHTALLEATSEPWYAELPDVSKCLLHHVWLMGTVHGGRIPEPWLTKERLNVQSKPNFDVLTKTGRVWFEHENGIESAPPYARDAHSGLSESKSLASHERESEGDFGLSAVLVARGLKIPEAKRPEIAKWPAKYGGRDAILVAFDANADAVLIADRPLQYLAAILRNMRPAGPVAAPEPKTWYEAYIDAMREFRGEDEAFARHFGFTRDDWRAHGDKYQAELRQDMSLEFPTWLKKRGAA